MSRVFVVTDSSANLTPERAEAMSVTLVPLQIIIAGESFADGIDEGASAPAIAEALRHYKPVSTSRPAPETFRAAYASLADQGAAEIISVQLSGAVSATLESAQLAARDTSVKVHVVDSRQIGAGTGYAVAAAVEALAAGASATQAAEAARAMGEEVKAYFYVDTLEYLRRSGRVGTMGALLGSALAVKPILTIDDGRIVPAEKVRTTARALARLEGLAVEAAEAVGVHVNSQGHCVQVTVCHLANSEAAEPLADKLAHTFGERLAPDRPEAPVRIVEVPAVVGAHVGPGLVGVIVAPVFTFDPGGSEPIRAADAG